MKGEWFINKSWENLFNLDEIRILATIGFFSLSTGSPKLSRKIFSNLLDISMTQSFSYIGLALSFLFCGSVNQSLEILELGLARCPSDKNEILLYMALCLLEDKKTKVAKEILFSLVSSNAIFGNHLELAQAVLRKY